MFFISAVVLPVPASLVDCPEVSVSQNELVQIEFEFPVPISPPTPPAPLTAPVL